MNARKIVRVVTVAALVLVTGSLGRGFSSRAEAKAIDSSQTPRVSGDVLDAGEVVIVESGQRVADAVSTHAFVVLRRADGSVPRAYLWDEPLGCPDSHVE